MVSPGNRQLSCFFLSLTPLRYRLGTAARAKKREEACGEEEQENKEEEGWEKIQIEASGQWPSQTVSVSLAPD